MIIDWSILKIFWHGKIIIFLFQTSEGWPDIVVWLLNGGSRVAFYKMSIADIVYSVIPEQNGQHCGRIQNIYLRVCINLLKCIIIVNSWKSTAGLWISCTKVTITCTLFELDRHFSENFFEMVRARSIFRPIKICNVIK